MRSSLRFFNVRISFVRFLVSSIFFHVFISSYLSSAMRFASSYASRSMLYGFESLNRQINLLFASLLGLCERVSLSHQVCLFLLVQRIRTRILANSPMIFCAVSSLGNVLAGGVMMVFFHAWV